VRRAWSSGFRLLRVHARTQGDERVEQRAEQRAAALRRRTSRLSRTVRGLNLK
jgi:hypothetical protein